MGKILDCIVDVSRWQQNINFDKLKAAGITAVIHKATQGYTGKDPKFLSRQKICRDMGFLFGSYHFGTSANVEAQVKNYLSVIGENPDELMVIDFEPNGRDTMSLEQLREFVTLVHEKTGRYILIYSGSHIKDLLGYETDELLANCPLWISQYRFGAPNVPANWSTWTFHQYTDGNAAVHKNKKGGLLYPRVETPGIGYCDRNYFNGDVEQLKLIWNAPDAAIQAEAIDGVDVEVEPEPFPGERTETA